MTALSSASNERMAVKLSELHAAAYDVHDLSHRLWVEVETLDAWERLFHLQGELAVLARGSTD